MTELSCFKAYDIRGKIDENIDADIAYRVGRATNQHFSAKSCIIGFDSRETSPVYAEAVGQGAMDAGANVINIGMAGTEEMYWAVTEFGACAGIEVTASHNPINYNGMKIVKSGSQPLDEINDFLVIKALAESQKWSHVKSEGRSYDYATIARKKYVDRILSFINVARIEPLKIVINSGNGAAGPTLDAIISHLVSRKAQIEFIRVHHEPDSNFPNGIPNPLLPRNHRLTADHVLSEGADMGVAFDGDFDRCFFFDSNGKFVPSEYVVGLLGAIFLEKEVGSKIVHDPRVIWNTQDIVAEKGGIAVQSKTGHAFIKQTMRTESAIYGGEMSAHHYFRDFAYCDSGMIPWLLITELISKTGRSLADWVSNRYNLFPSTGETNFYVDDVEAAVSRVVSKYNEKAISLDETDGVSLTFENWRFNLRCSNTEPLIRLNIEGRGRNSGIQDKLKEISTLIGGQVQ